MYWSFLLLPLGAAPSTPAVSAQECGYEIVRIYPHDRASFTQGLFFDGGHLYESSGQYGRSGIARIDLASGKVLAQTQLPATEFGEGITRWRDQIISVTWQNGVGHRWRAKDLKLLDSFAYQGEGWGLTLYKKELVWSDGSATLRFLDPATLQEKRRVEVRFAGQPVSQLNELETINGEIWANVWHSDRIARIDPANGTVTSWVDLTGLKQEAGARGQESVLNGIAWDARHKRLFVTGKYWPKLFEIRLTGC